MLAIRHRNNLSVIMNYLSVINRTPTLLCQAIHVRRSSSAVFSA